MVSIKKKKENKTFICDIDIMEIQYNDNSKIYRKSNIFLKANTSYELKIDELPTGKIIRKYFDNNNWCVSYYKKGISRNEYNHSFALEILALPSNVKTIKVKMTKYVRYFQNSYKWKKNSEVIYEFSYRHNSTDLSLNLDKYLELESFKIIIDILEIYDLNEVKIK
eukprot:124613_1